MTVPTYDRCMIPLLQFASDGNPHHIREAIEALASYFELTEVDRAERLPSGRKFTFDDRVQWANTYLKKAGLLKKVKWGVFQITDRGFDVLDSGIDSIDSDFLMQFPEFQEFKSRKAEPGRVFEKEQESEQTPQEVLQKSYQTLIDELAQNLLEKVMDCSASFFEQLVMQLLLALGYGSAIPGAGEVIGGPGDTGIDGIIKEDKLGFNAIYIQAKKWDSDRSVGRQDIQAFAGSLMGHGATKGVFITTAHYPREAIEYADALPQIKIILIDGQQLAKLMIDNNIGVSP
jgi:restriction system protein